VGGNGPLIGGREGSVIRTVSCGSAGFDAGGVSAMRTVSFFGSVGSAMEKSQLQIA
jgi:hypothetical protein